MKHQIGRSSRAKKPRNKMYRPKAVEVGGGLQAFVRIEDRARQRLIAGQPLPQALIDRVASIYWMAFSDIKCGAAGQGSWEHVAGSLNMGLLLAEQGVGSEHIDTMGAAQASLHRALLRGHKSGSYRLDGPGIAMITEALQIHDVQLEHATPNDMLQAERELEHRMKNGHVFADCAAH